MLNNKIIVFFNKQHLLSLATYDAGQVYSASCFFSYYEKDNFLIFSSDKNSRHIKEAMKITSIAGTIALDTKRIGIIKGIQFIAKIEEAKNELLKIAKSSYLSKFPYARFHLQELWILRLKYIKYTDNKLGFGKKIIWQI